MLEELYSGVASSTGAATNAESLINDFLNGTGVVARKMMANNSVDTTKIADGAVDATKLGARAVGTSHIKDGAVLGDKIADSNIYTRHLVENIIVTNRIKNRAVTSEKIALGGVGYSELDESIRRLILEFRDDYSDAMTTENEEWVV